jgi:hypothetical protein
MPKFKSLNMNASGNEPYTYFAYHPQMYNWRIHWIHSIQK